MDREQRVQVVLGEAEPGEEVLRFVLEGEGFDIVGLASSDEELDRVLQGARPSVIVLDAGISATAAIDARERANGATLVVVWPEGVAAVIAEERVDPYAVIDDLGDAVRRASLKASVAEPPIQTSEPVREAAPIRRRHATSTLPALVARSEEDRSGAVRVDGSLRRVLIAVGTWILVLSLTTIAVALPKALEFFSVGRGPRPSPSAVAPSHSSGPTAVDAEHRRTGRDEERSRRPGCEPGKVPTDRGKPSTDRRADREHSMACRTSGEKGKGHGKSQTRGAHPGTRGHRRNVGKGRNAVRAGGPTDKPTKPERAKGGTHAEQPGPGATR